MPGTRKLGRKTDHRMSMLKGMVTFLLEKGQIETTYTRAKEVSALADKMITLGKENTLASKRRAMSFLKKESVVYKLFTSVAPLYTERNGGYTRVLKTGPRRGDGAEMAIIAMVDADAIYAPTDKKGRKIDLSKAAKKEDTKIKPDKTPADKAPAKPKAKKADADKKPAAKKAPAKKAEPKAPAAEVSDQTEAAESQAE